MNETAETPRRRRWAFSLRTLMIFVLIVGGLLGWKANRASRQRQAAAIIRTANGAISYDFQSFPNGTPAATRKAAKPPGPEWLRKWIGDEYFQEISGVSFPGEVSTQVLEAVASLEQLRVIRINKPLSNSQELLPLTALPHLEIVDLCGPAVDDTLMKHLSLSQSIIVIETHETNVTDKGVNYLPKMPNLKHLSIYNSPKVTDASVEEVISRLTKLTDLDLSGTSVTDTGIEAIGKMTNLTSLSVNDLDLTDRSTISLTRLIKLRLLFLDRTKITDEGLSRLGALTELIQISLRQTQIQGSGFANLQNLQKIIALRLEGSNFSDEGMQHLSRLKALQEIRLSRTWVSDVGLASLQGLPRLRSLTMVSTQVTDAGMDAFRAANPRVRQAINKPVGRPSPPSSQVRP